MMKKKMFITKMIIVTMDAMKQIWREICYCENEGCRVVLVSCDCSWLMVVREKQKEELISLRAKVIALEHDLHKSCQEASKNHDLCCQSSCGIAAFIREK
ncbi:hypothetical protein NC653_041174 [Populus alba x Populus x berolinensis]|uniref:Uncharacterized protein n=1 Tax=Populus alba x Populus x berolinensis TaxID=444605 RepID=A0AAD6PNW5_9ROSI|nr:hypothetical protein NC653_041174 [Populus alba x Populus x berolinensis]